MTHQIDSPDWEGDFVQFLRAEPKEPPAHVSRDVRERIGALLEPSPWLVFSKLVGVVTLAGSILLSVCPQFGFAYFRSDVLVQFFQKLGPHVCHFACGAFFVGSALIVAAFILHPEDLRVIRKHRFLQVVSLSVLALSAFVALGAKVFLPMFLAWLVGAIVGGLLSLELSCWMRLTVPKVILGRPT